MRLQKGFLGDEEVKKLVARGCLGIQRRSHNSKSQQKEAQIERYNQK